MHTVTGEEKKQGTLPGNNAVLWAIGRAPNTDIGLEHVVRPGCYPMLCITIPVGIYRESSWMAEATSKWMM